MRKRVIKKRPVVARIDIGDMDSSKVANLLSSNNEFIRITAEREMERRKHIADTFGC